MAMSFADDADFRAAFLAYGFTTAHWEGAGWNPADFYQWMTTNGHASSFLGDYSAEKRRLTKPVDVLILDEMLRYFQEYGSPPTLRTIQAVLDSAVGLSAKRLQAAKELLAAIAQEIPALRGDFLFWADQVVKHHLEQQTARILDEITDVRETDNPRDIFRSLLQQMNEIEAQTAGASGNTQRSMSLSEAYAEYRAAYESGNSRVVAAGTVPYPWEPMNVALSGGMAPGDLVMIAGADSVGKSIFGKQLAFEAALSGKTVVCAELELNPTQWQQRVISYFLQIPQDKMKSRHLSDDEQQAFYLMQEQIEQLERRGGLYYLPPHECRTPAMINSTVSRRLAGTKPDFLQIDHLTILEPNRPMRDSRPHEDVEKMLVEIRQQLASRYGIPVLSFVHTNAQGNVRYKSVMNLADIVFHMEEVRNFAPIAPDPMRGDWMGVPGLVQLTVLRGRSNAKGAVFTFKIYPAIARMEYVAPDEVASIKAIISEMRSGAR